MFSVAVDCTLAQNQEKLTLHWENQKTTYNNEVGVALPDKLFTRVAAVCGGGPGGSEVWY